MKDTKGLELKQIDAIEREERDSRDTDSEEEDD